MQVISVDKITCLNRLNRPNDAVSPHVLPKFVILRVKEGNHLHVRSIAVLDCRSELIVHIPNGSLVQLLRARQSVATSYLKEIRLDFINL